MKALVHAWRDFCRNSDGMFATALAILLPVILGVGCGALDYYMYLNHKARLQEVANLSSLAAAKEAAVKGWDEQIASQVVAATFEANMNNALFGDLSFTQDVRVDVDERQVQVILTQDHYAYFVLGYFTGSPQVTVSATARASGETDICVISLAGSGKGVGLQKKSTMTAAECSVYANSLDTNGIEASSGSSLVTELTCTAGGAKGPATSYAPPPLTDCPAIRDPMEDRGALLASQAFEMGCTATKMTIKGGARTLSPGVYCGGLTLDDRAQVTLMPGIYVFRNGKLKADGNASLVGTNVGFVFEGENSGLELKNKSAVSLSAPEDGAMAGILMYAVHHSKKARDFKIESRDAQKLVGAVYLPSDKLIIGGDQDEDGICDDDVFGTTSSCLSDVGSASSWTAIICKTVQVASGVTLTLNADYKASRVPVPDGVGPNSVSVYLGK